MEENREQPIIMPAHALNPADENGAMSEVGSQNQEGKLGKFKSVEALMDAYDSLQAEFTKKCQLLSELKKGQEVSQESDDNLSEEVQQDNQTSQVVEGQNKQLQFDEDGLNEFLSQFDEAQGYAQQIKERFATAQPQNSNPYAVAWAEVLLKNLKDNNASSDPIINQYVLSDEKIRNKIIEEYLIGLNNSKPPIVISSQSGERLSGVMPDNPKTLSDAKRIVKKMFS